MDNIYNQEASTQNTVEIKETVQTVKTVKTYPTKTEIVKAFSKPKTELLFTEKDLTDIKAGLGFLDLNLQTDDISVRTNVVKSIEALINTMHKPFIKSFKDYKKGRAVYKTFLTDFFNDCNDKLIQEKAVLEQGNEVLKIDVIGRTLDVLKSKISHEIDFQIIKELNFSTMSVPKKEAVLKAIKESK